MSGRYMGPPKPQLAGPQKTIDAILVVVFVACALCLFFRLSHLALNVAVLIAAPGGICFVVFGLRRFENLLDLSEKLKGHGKHHKTSDSRKEVK